MHGAAFNISPLVVKLLADNGADPQIWNNPNKAGGTPLFIAEGYISRLPRPDTPTIDAITKLMLAAGISTEGKRPKIVDSYEKPLAAARLPTLQNDAPIWFPATALELVSNSNTPGSASVRAHVRRGLTDAATTYLRKRYKRMP